MVDWSIKKMEIIANDEQNNENNIFVFISKYMINYRCIYFFHIQTNTKI